MFGIRIHFGGIGIGIAQHIAGKFNNHALHTQTNAKGGDIVFAGIFQCRQLAIDTPLSESRSNDNTVGIL